MKILAIDTSSKNAAVAITENEEKLIELNNSDEKTHSQKLMPMIDEAFQKINLSLEDIDLIACCIGPGSFTGVRIGIATAKAFADSRNIPVVGISSLEALAHTLNEEGCICSSIDAGHGNSYTGFFEIKKDENGRMQTKKIDYKFLSADDETIDMSKFKIIKDSENMLLGITIAKLGYTKYKNGEYGNSSTLLPLYLRKSQAELQLEDKKE